MLRLYPTGHAIAPRGGRLAELQDLGPGSTVAEIGAGEGRMTLRPGGRLAVIDFEPRAWRFWLSRSPGGA